MGKESTTTRFSLQIIFHSPCQPRASKSKCSYRIKASKHFVAGQINPDVETLLVCNNIYGRSDKDGLKGGEGGGYLALFEVAINTALKNREAKRERKARSTYTRTTATSCSSTSRTRVERTCIVSLSQYSDVYRPVLSRKRSVVTSAKLTYRCRSGFGSRRIALPLLEATTLRQITGRHCVQVR